MSLLTQTEAPPRSSSQGSSWVEPIEAVESGILRCSALENLCARVYPSPTLFFQLRANEDPLQHYKHMCRGLGRVLNKYPFMAGTLRSDERGAYNIEIPPAPRAGARFHYADFGGDYTFPSFRELQAGGFPFADGKNDGLSKLKPDPFPLHVDGSPAFLPQLTHVRGGLILTMAMSHLLGDMVILHKFLDSWAEETYEVATALAEGRPEAPVPKRVADELVDRSRLIPQHDGPAGFEEMARLAKALPDWTLVNPTDPVALENMKSIVPPPYIPPSQAHATQELRTTVASVWRFPLASLKALHRAVQAASPTSSKISSSDVLTAYLWERIFQAKYLPSASETTQHLPTHSELVFAGELRRRLNPPLPADFLGGCVDMMRCSAPTRTMTARTTGKNPKDFSNLATLALSLRASNAAWAEPQYHTLLTLSQRTPLSPGFVPRGPIDLLCTDHSRAPSVRTSSWGPTLGCSVAYREPYIGRDPPAGEITVLPRCADGGLEVMVSAERVVVERLGGDGDLGGWGERVFVLGDVVEEKRGRDARARL